MTGLVLARAAAADVAVVVAMVVAACVLLVSPWRRKGTNR